MPFYIYMCIGGSSSTEYTGDDSSENAKWKIPYYDGEFKRKTFETLEEAEAKRNELQKARDTEERYYVNGRRIEWKPNENGLVCVGMCRY